MNPAPAIEHFGIAVGALSGVLAARGTRFDLFGILVLAVVAALGGGTVRDMMAGDTPVYWLKTPQPLMTALLTALSAFFLFRTREPHAGLFQVADAFALAFFSVAGVQKGLGLGFGILPAVVLGVVTGVFGGIIRDVLTARVPQVFQPEIYLYATASASGGIVYCLLFIHAPFVYPAWTAIAVTLALRLGALRMRLALPVFSTSPNDSK